MYRAKVSGNLTLSLKCCPQMLSSPSPSSSSQLSQLGASLYAPQSKFFPFCAHIAAVSDIIWLYFRINGSCLPAGALGFSVRGMGNNTPQLNRNLTQGTQLPSHITPTTGVPTMSLHTPPSPSRCSPMLICHGRRCHAHL